jgi:hypothetical protein
MSSQHDEVSAPQDATAALGQATSAQPAGLAGPGQPAGLAPPGPSAGLAAPARPAGDAGVAKVPWKATNDDKTVFRRGGPLALWWIWLAFAVYNFIDVAILDHSYFSFELTAGLLTVTALMYACALRPRVVADSDGIYVYNPFRDHMVRWGAVKGVYLGDSLELSCARRQSDKDKTLYCWALYSGRRSRLKRGTRRSQARMSWRVPARASAEVQELLKQDPVQVMAAELGRRSTEARGLGAPDAILESRWAWRPLAYLLIPAAALLAFVLAR